MVRAGSQGEVAAQAIRDGVAVIGWGGLGDLRAANVSGVEDVKRLLRERDDRELSPAQLTREANEIYSFFNEIAEGDVVVLPLSTQEVAIGTVTGGYFFAQDDDWRVRQRLPVEWRIRRVSRSELGQALDEALGRRSRGTTVKRLDPSTALPAVRLLGDGPARTWIFQGNPNRYRITEALAAYKEITWTVTRFKGEIAPGDSAYMWRSNPDAGLLAAATVLEAPRPADDRHYEDEFWVEPPERSDDDLVSLLRIDRVLEPPLLRAQLMDHPVLRDLTVITSPTGTNFAVTPEQDAALQELIAAIEPAPGVTERSFWWVNQGSAYTVSRNGDLMWAPQLAKNGHPLPHWERLKEASVGDVVLHCAAGKIRAVSSVTATAVEAPRPEGFPAEGSWQEAGYLVETGYRELAEPVAVQDIPLEWRKQEGGPFNVNGNVQQGYFFSLSEKFAEMLGRRFPQLGLISGGVAATEDYSAPAFATILQALHDAGMSITERMLRRYHVALKTRGFVILAGVSGTGKTWLAELYASTIGAARCVVPVAPNWTTNEDLLGYWNPLENAYHDTEFSQFLRDAAAEYESARVEEREPQPFHLILDEMNLAHVEYYFAKFLSAMELRARDVTAAIALAPNSEVLLTPNLIFVGTVNVDETTKGFADKVYDRAQLIELELVASELEAFMAGKPYVQFVMDVFDAVKDVAPFAFRTLNEIARYTSQVEALGGSIDEALDEQLLQKVLPKVKGTDQRIGTALGSLRDLTESSHPLSHAKVIAMLETFNQHGFASYF